MPFNVALSGLKAASGDLKITGNNIANASTIGFKESRAEFADVYSSSVLGDGSASIGSGVKLSNVAQQFEQGTIGFTSNSLDVAIDGQGFFVLDDGGTRTYTRAGMFGLDQDGFVTSNSGARLQGFTANETGTLNGVISDIVIQRGNLSPNQTTQVETDVNLNAESEVLANFGTTIDSLGQQIGQAQAGVEVDIPSVVNTLAVPTPGDFSNATSATFDVTLDGASANNGGPVTVTLDTDIQDLDDLINDIRDDLRAANIGVDVREDPDNVGQLQFYATTAGEASNITIDNFSGNTIDLAATLNLASGVSTPGIAAVDNAYLSQSIDIVDASGREVVTNTVTTLDGETAAQIVARFNNIPGVSASASTSATLTAADYVNNSGAMALTINSVEFTSASLADLADDINASDSLGGISAELDVDTGDLNITNSLGTDLRFSISSLDALDSFSVQGPTGASVELDIGGDIAAAVGGSLNLILAEGVTLASPNPAQTGLFGSITEADFAPSTVNSFNPVDQDTYNSATSVTLFDSLGNP
ncbi:MAG: flagellar hook protein FlgE, partial [Candidatus Azotimanducaceae bacterium]